MGFNVDSTSTRWAGRSSLGLVFCFIFRKAAKSATAGVPGGLQNAIEMIVEFIDDTTRSIFNLQERASSRRWR